MQTNLSSENPGGLFHLSKSNQSCAVARHGFYGAWLHLANPLIVRLLSAHCLGDRMSSPVISDLLAFSCREAAFSTSVVPCFALSQFCGTT